MTIYLSDSHSPGGITLFCTLDEIKVEASVRNGIKGKKVKVSVFIQRFFCSTHKALRHGSHSFTWNYTNACLYLVGVHQMAPPQTEVADL